MKMFFLASKKLDDMWWWHTERFGIAIDDVIAREKGHCSTKKTKTVSFPDKCKLYEREPWMFVSRGYNKFSSLPRRRRVLSTREGFSHRKGKRTASIYDKLFSIDWVTSIVKSSVERLQVSIISVQKVYPFAEKQIQYSGAGAMFVCGVSYFRVLIKWILYGTRVRRGSTWNLVSDWISPVGI